MSRNSKRLQPQSNPDYKEERQENPTPPPTVNNSSPFGISFVVPTETVELPSQGSYYPVSSPMFGVSSVEIKFMTAKEEDILSSDPSASGTFDKLIDSLLVTKGITSQDFLEEDKLAVLLAARRSGYGQIYETEVYCNNCKEPTVHEFDLSIVSFKNQTSEEISYDPETNSFKCTLPLTNIEVQLLNVTPDDNENIETERKQKKKYNLPFNFTMSFLKTAIVSANGVTNRQEIDKLVDVLPAADAKKILNFYSTCRPVIDTTQQVSCSVCDTQTEREVPLSWAFFRTDT